MTQIVQQQAVKISVIVPIYNMEKYLEECLSSICRQTYSSFEALLIDDGSTDKSYELCLRYKASDPRIRIIRQPNRGLSSARNTGLRNARGEYITFVDADDHIHKDYLKSLLDLCISFHTDISACNHNIVRNGCKKTRFPTTKEPVTLSCKQALEGVLFQRIPDVSCWGKLYRSGLLKDIRYPEGRLYEDTYVFADIMLRTKAISYTPIPLYNYVQHTDSISHGYYTESRHEYIDAVDHMIKLIEASFPDMKEACLCRYAFALMSVRRFYVDCSSELIAKRKAIDAEIKNYSKILLFNCHVPIRDKIAMIALLIHPRMYDCLWKAYEYIRRNKTLLQKKVG